VKFSVPSWCGGRTCRPEEPVEVGQCCPHRRYADECSAPSTWLQWFPPTNNQPRLNVSDDYKTTYSERQTVRTEWWCEHAAADPEFWRWNTVTSHCTNRLWWSTLCRSATRSRFWDAVTYWAKIAHFHYSTSVFYAKFENPYFLH